MMSEPILLPLGDETYELQPTLAAMKKINDRFTSLLDCSQRIVRYDFSAHSFVIAAGAALSPTQTKEMEARLVGRMQGATDQLGKFLARLMNGGVENAEGADQGEA